MRAKDKDHDPSHPESESAVRAPMGPRLRMSHGDTAVQTRFRELSRKASRGRGLTMPAIADAAALAEEETKPEPEPERIRFLRQRLGLKDENASDY